MFASASFCLYIPNCYNRADSAVDVVHQQQGAVAASFSASIAERERALRKPFFKIINFQLKKLLNAKMH